MSYEKFAYGILIEGFVGRAAEKVGRGAISKIRPLQPAGVLQSGGPQMGSSIPDRIKRLTTTSPTQSLGRRPMMPGLKRGGPSPVGEGTTQI